MILKKKTLKKRGRGGELKCYRHTDRHTDIQTYRHTDRPSGDEAAPRVAFAPKNLITNTVLNLIKNQKVQVFLA